MRGLAVAAIVLGMSLAATPAVRAQSYTYTGLDFAYTGTNGSGTTPFSLSDSITGTFTLAAPLSANMAFGSISPLSFSFADGVDVITDSNGVAPIFDVSTNGLGQITGWQIEVYSFNPSTNILASLEILYNDPSLANINGDSVDDILCSAGTYANGGCRYLPSYSSGGNSVGGNFSQTDAPEPATAALMLSGLLGVGSGLARTRRTRKQV